MAGYRLPNESDEYRARRDELLEMEKDASAHLEAVAQKRRELPLGGRLKESYRFEQVASGGEAREGVDDPSVVSMMNCFRKTADGVFHTWGSEIVSHPMENGHPRHVDIVWPYWNLLDMTPEGRGEGD